MSILYSETLSDITPQMLLTGFFDGWPNHPSADTHMKILENSQHIILAIDTELNQIVGFINAVSDNILSAYIPLLEVLPKYKNQGIGSGLITRMLKKLENLYMIDLTCDDNLQQFYKSKGMIKASDRKVGTMLIRNFDNQSGCAE